MRILCALFVCLLTALLLLLVCAVLSVKGSRSAIQGWVLGKLNPKNAFINGHIGYHQMITPSVGVVEQVDLKMKGNFRFMRFNDEDFGKSRLYDTRVEVCSPFPLQRSTARTCVLCSCHAHLFVCLCACHRSPL